MFELIFVLYKLQEEIQKFIDDHGIVSVGSKVLRPISSFEEAGFSGILQWYRHYFSLVQANGVLLHEKCNGNNTHFLHNLYTILMLLQLAGNFLFVIKIIICFYFLTKLIYNCFCKKHVHMSSIPVYYSWGTIALMVVLLKPQIHKKYQRSYCSAGNTYQYIQCTCILRNELEFDPNIFVQKVLTLNINKAFSIGKLFYNCSVSDTINSTLQSKCWESPTPIQRITWPQVLSGSDVVGIAQTGSGKTLGVRLLYMYVVFSSHVLVTV